MPINGLELPCLQVLLVQRSFLLVARSDHTTESINIKLEVVFKVQKMAWYRPMPHFASQWARLRGGVPVFARWPVSVRVRVSFMTGAVRSAILATAGLFVYLCCLELVLTYCLRLVSNNKT